MDHGSMEEGLGFAIRCVRCGSLLTLGSTQGEATCDNCGFHMKLPSKLETEFRLCAPKRDIPAAIALRDFSSVEPVAERGLIDVFIQYQQTKPQI